MAATLLVPSRERTPAMARVISPDGLFDSTDYMYSQARVEGGTLYLSGQIGVDAELRVAGDDIESQTRKAFDNVGAVLDEIDKGFDDVAKVTSYVVDLAENVDGYRGPWGETFDEPYPCHTLIGVDQLSPIADGELLVELEAEVPLDG